MVTWHDEVHRTTLTWSWRAHNTLSCQGNPILPSRRSRGSSSRIAAIWEATCCSHGSRAAATQSRCQSLWGCKDNARKQRRAWAWKMSAKSLRCAGETTMTTELMFASSASSTKMRIAYGQRQELDRGTGEGMWGRRQARAVTHRLEDAIQVEHREKRGGQRLGGGEELLPSDPTDSAARDHGGKG